MEPTIKKPVRIATVKQMAAQHAGVFTESALRALIHNAEPRFASNGHQIPGNGLAEAGAILRIGRRVLFDLDRFEDWLKSHGSRREVR